jgi:methyl-accepting chemotaxis protein
LEVEMELAEEFRAWANARKTADPRKDLALKVALALEDEEASTKWSLLNVREEFAARPARQSTRTWVGQFFIAIVYILPVLVAWWHLKNAFSGYAQTVRAVKSDQQLNFLAYWTGAYDGEPGVVLTSSAASAARSIIALILLLIAVQFVFNWYESKFDDYDQQLDDLITEANLRFAEHRAVRPEELANGINAAAAQLGVGLLNLRQVFEDTTSLVREVQGFTGTITESTTALKIASESLIEAMKPLSGFGASAEKAADVMESTVLAVNGARTAFTEGTRDGAKVIQQAGEAFGDELASNVRALEYVRDTMKEVGSAVKNTATGFVSVVDGSVSASDSVRSVVEKISGMSDDIARSASSLKSVGEILSEANRKMSDIAASADSPQIQPYVVAVRNHSEAMVQATQEIKTAIKYLGDELNRWMGPDA